MDSLKLAALKGTGVILTAARDGSTWSQLMEACRNCVSHRIFNKRLKELEEAGFIKSKAIIHDKKAVKLYRTTKKGEKLLALIGQIAEL